MISRPIPRRTFLRGAGVMLGLPLLEAMPIARALGGQMSPAPMRLVCIANPLGMLPEAFFPATAGSAYEVPESLRVLEPHRGDFTVFSHLDHDVTGGHRGVHSFLTGMRDSEAKDWPDGNISVDQRAAESVGSKTRFPSLTVSVGNPGSGELDTKLSWTRNGINIPPVTRPSELFRALFMSEDAEARRRQAHDFELGASILDAVRGHARSLERRLGTADRRKLDEYLTSVREVERKLGMAREWLDRPKPQVEQSMPADAGFAATVPVMFDLITLALQTDSTRVATLGIPATLDMADLGLEGSYHGFSHHGKSDVLQRGLLVIEKFQTEQLARFVTKLKETREPGGKTLLDRTMVLFGSGMGNGSSHSNKDLPVLVAGGGFRHGEHKVYPNEPRRRVPLCNLYTSILQRFGVETERFNKATGTLSDFA